MGIGRFFYEDWEWDGVERLEFYDLFPEPQSTNSLGVLTDLALDGILVKRASTEVSPQELDIMSKFTNVVHNCIFGTSAPVTKFRFYIVLISKGQLDMAMMESCLSDACMKYPPEWLLMKTPFIVRFSISERLYRVRSVCPEHPSTVEMTVDNYNKHTLNDHRTSVESFYKSKYNREVSSAAIVLVGEMGACIPSFPIVSSPDEQEVTSASSTKTSSQLFLVSDFCHLHPLTEAMDLLSHLPRRLFWIETGLISRRVSVDSFGPSESWSGLCFDQISVSNIFPSNIITLTSMALSCPSAQMGRDFNYEKLEWLGDCVWRLVALRVKTDSVRYNTMMSNEYIGDRVSIFRPNLVDQCVMSNKPSLKNPQRARSKLLNFRILADIAEALLAVAYLAGGLRLATQTAERLGLIEEEIIDEKNSDEKRRLDVTIEIFKTCFADPNVSVGTMHNRRKRILTDAVKKM